MIKENTFPDTLKTWAQTLKRLILLEKDAPSSLRELTNERLVHLAVNQFTKEMKKNSMGKILAFPMCFYIDLHDDDFLRMKQYFPLIVIELKSRLAEIIEKEKTKFARCTPAASYWYFEFRASGQIDVPGNDKIKWGKPDIKLNLRGKRKPTGTTTTGTDPSKTLNTKFPAATTPAICRKRYGN